LYFSLFLYAIIKSKIYNYEKFLLLMASVIIITSCSQENEQLLTKENSVENSMKSSSNISVLYLKLIANHFTNPESFDNLSCFDPYKTRVILHSTHKCNMS
jgi:hypothetical protein